MNPFKIFWQRNQRETEFQESMALQEAQTDVQAPADPYEAIKQAEREKLMLGDEGVTKLLLRHPELHALIPALAPVNRTTKHISKIDAQVAWLDWQILTTLQEMCMNPEDYERGLLELLQGFEMYYNTQVSDGYEGWKGRILTEQKKIHVSELRKGK
jgi:hypothetical protein